MKIKYVIYDIEYKYYYMGDSLPEQWSKEFNMAEHFKTSTEAYHSLINNSYPTGYYQILEIYVKG